LLDQKNVTPPSRERFGGCATDYAAADNEHIDLVHNRSEYDENSKS
jgi:hypothetical protein